MTIFTFLPAGGPVGTVVTIHGTGFSATPGQNAVTFNGTAATVSSATTTKLVVTVPAGATTGTIGVTAPGGSAASANVFTVGPLNVPTITGFTPMAGVAGTSVTINGTNFDPVPANDQTRFNKSLAVVTGATPTALTAVVPPSTGSGRITATTPLGTAVSANDFFIAPPPYTVADLSFTSRISYGTAVTVPISTAGKIALVLFDAVPGQRISLKVTGVTITSGVITVLKPQAAQLASFSFATSGAFLDTQVLNALGTYTIMVDPNLSYTGSVTLTLYDVPPDVTGPIVPGGSAVPVTLGTPARTRS